MAWVYELYHFEEVKTFLLITTYLIGAGELFLAFFFLITHSKSEIRKVMALLFFCTGVWAITNGFTSYVNPSLWVDWNLKIVFISGITVVASLLHLSIIFPYRTFTFDKLHSFLIYAPALFLSTVLLLSSTIINSYTVARDNVGIVHPGPLFIFYNIILAIYYFLAVAILILKERKLDGMHKLNIRLFMAGVIIGGFPAIFLNVLFAFSGIYINPLLPVIFSVIWVGFTTYIIIKK